MVLESGEGCPKGHEAFFVARRHDATRDPRAKGSRPSRSRFDADHTSVVLADGTLSAEYARLYKATRRVDAN